MTTAPKIVVCGSINMDLVVRCERLPLAGQTIAAESAREVCGGKGANQAVAAAKSGGEVSMIARVGSDGFASTMRQNLVACGVDDRWVRSSKNCPSGMAIVTVENSGENAILILAGANGNLSVEDVEAARGEIETADVLLLQLEVPTETVIRCIEIAKQSDVRCIVDPAPVGDDFSDGLLNVDLVCPNETEAEMITGIRVNSIDEAKSAANQLQQRGATNVAITRGDRGTLLLHGGDFHHLETISISAVDTTAAGDAFAGALAVHWAQTNDLIRSVRFANVAGALAATRAGAQPSLPTRTEIDSSIPSRKEKR